MSDKKKPDQGHCGSNGEDDGNRRRSLNQHSVEENRMSLEWLLFIVAVAGFLAFQIIADAIFEEEYERDVAWIARQSRSMSSIDEADDYMDDYMDDYLDDYMDDYMEDEDIEFEDFEDEEELQNQVEEAEDRAEAEMHTEEGAGASCRVDLATCTFPDCNFQRHECNCKLFYFFRDPTFLVSAPVEPEEPTECECENANEEAAKEKEDNETEELRGESEKNLDSAKGSLP